MANKPVAEMTAAEKDRMCGRKKAYASENHAIGMAVQQVSGGSVQKLSWYRCPVCGLWHLTRGKGRGRR